MPHKNAKYLFYRFNDYIKMSGGKRQIIKHTLKVKDSRNLKKETHNSLCKK